MLGNIGDCVKKIFFYFTDFSLDLHKNKIYLIYFTAMNSSQSYPWISKNTDMNEHIIEHSVLMCAAINCVIIKPFS